MARPRKEEPFNFDEFNRVLHERIKTQAERPNIHGYKPHDKQVIFHAAERRHRLYIGGNRSGKTTGGIAEDIWWLTGKHPYRRVPSGGVRGRIIGVDFLDGIEKILKPEMMRWCPISELRGNSWTDAYDVQERTLHFENGSFVEFMSYEQEVAKFAGTSRHFVHFDEEPPQDIYIENLLRLLDTKGSWWMTLTPVMGMEWMYDEVFLPGKNDPTSMIEVIEVDMTENPYLDAVEIVNYISMIPEEDVDARKAGKFVRRGGLIYKEFDSKIHVIDPLTSIPKSWEIYVSIDHGYNNPTSIHWHGVDPDGNIITFYEHYESEMIVEDHAAQVHLINSTLKITPGMYIGDPAIAQHNGISGSTIQQEYGKHGIHISLANNEVLNGINKVNTYIKRQRWHVTRNCEFLQKEIVKYRWKTWSNKKSERQNNPFDVPHKKNDHAMDDLRYFMTIMPDLTPVVQSPPPVAEAFAAANGSINPYAARFDTNLKRPKVQGDWFIQGTDEHMGGEW